MLKVIYHVDGLVVADKMAMETARDIINRYKDKEINRIKVANELVFLALRLCVKNGKISNKDICFVYGDTEIFIDRYGYLDEWPDGFCDVVENMMVEQIGWDE